MEIYPGENDRLYEVNPYTFAIGIKCKDSVVIATDSLRIDHGCKRHEDKIHLIGKDNKAAICAIGRQYDVSDIASKFKYYDSCSNFFNIKELVLELHKENNIDKMSRYGIGPTLVFSPDILVADKDELYHVEFFTLLRKRGGSIPYYSIDRYNTYQITGGHSEVGLSIFDIIAHKFYKKNSYELEPIDTGIGITIAFCMLSYVIKSCVGCGGPVQMAVSYKDAGATILDENEMIESYKKNKDEIPFFYQVEYRERL